MLSDWPVLYTFLGWWDAPGFVGERGSWVKLWVKLWVLGAWGLEVGSAKALQRLCVGGCREIVSGFVFTLPN